MSEKLYAERSIGELWPHYTKHISAMTGEALHSKTDISAELAWRDAQIERKDAAIAELLAALKRIELFDSMDYGMHIRGVQQIAKEAIAKAEK